MNQFILALCGIPASGKTSLARAIHQALSDESAVEVVSSDDWRDEAFYSDFSPELENNVRKEALRRTEELVQSGLSVIHDDTNYYTSMRHELYEIAVRLGCAFGVVYISTPLTRSLEWNDSREHPIPVEVVQRIKERMDIPGTKYAWDRPTAIVDLSKESPREAAKKVVESLRKQVLPAMEKSVGEESRIYGDLDLATRRIVSEFLREHPSFRSDQRVSRLRRELLKEAQVLRLKVREAERILKTRLEILAARLP